MALLPTDPLIFDPNYDVATDDITRHLDTYDLDLATGQFIDDGFGSVAVITDEEAFTQRLHKALETRRGEFLAYTLNYGHDYGQYLDDDPADTATREGLLESYVADCLLAIEGVDAVEDVAVEVLTLGTNEVRITLTVLDTFGSAIALDRTLNA